MTTTPASIATGLAKLRASINVRAVGRAATAGVRLPVGNALDTLFPTAIYISLISLLDEALGLAISSRGIGAVSGLGKRISALESASALIDPGRLRRLKGRRNAYAHESTAYASWQDVEELLVALDEEFAHLGL